MKPWTILSLLLCSVLRGQSVQYTFPVTQPSNVVVTIATTQPTTQPAPLPTPNKMVLGTNVLANDAIQGAGQWCDVTHQCTGIFNTGTPNTSAAWTYLFGYPTGDYSLSWTGGQNAVTIVGKSISPQSDNAGGWKATVQFNAGDRCEFRFTTNALPTNVHLFAPDATPSQMYRSAYLASLKGYKCIRLMPMERVNGIKIPPVYHPIAGGAQWNPTWGSRVTLDQWDWTTNEVPLEAQAELCKELGMVTPWVCVPYWAPDDYVQGVVQIFKNAGFTTIKLEHSNELWNFSVAYQGNQIRNDAIKAGTYGTLDPNVAGARRDGEYTAHMSVLAHAIMPGVQVVIGGQATWSAWLNDASSYMPAGSAQVGAVAPYFQPIDSSSNTVAGILASCDTWITTILDPGLRDNAAVCAAKNLELDGYESGQSLISQNAGQLPNIALLPDSPAQTLAFNIDPMTQCQFDPGIGTLYTKLFVVCQNRGVVVCCHFMAISNWGRSGYWGLFQQLGEKDNPKSLATKGWMAQ